jgi:mercuric ion transport protein
MVRTIDCGESGKFFSRMSSSNANASLFASALAAIGASVCCVGPLVLLMLGIGGAWVAHLTALEPLRPWFIAATLLFLGLAFHRLFLRPRVCEPGSPCAEPIALRRQRWISRLSPSRCSCCCWCPGWRRSSFEVILMRKSLVGLVLAIAVLGSLAAPSQTAVLDVQNMSCGLCPVTVKKALEKVPGVSQAQIDFHKKTATVTFRPTRPLPQGWSRPPPKPAFPRRCASDGRHHSCAGLDPDMLTLWAREVRAYAHRCLPVLLRMRAVQHRASAAGR